MVTTDSQTAEEYLAQNRQAAKANPTCGITRYNLAVALIAQNQFDEAEKELQSAVSCSPTLAEGFVLLGGICMNRNDLEGCLQYNLKAVQARTNFAEGYGNIGFVCLQQGRLDEAVAALEKAVNCNPNFLQAYTNMGNAYLMKGMPEKSIEANKKALEIEPAFAVAHFNLALAYLEKGVKGEAVTHFDQAEKLGYSIPQAIREEIERIRQSS